MFQAPRVAQSAGYLHPLGSLEPRRYRVRKPLCRDAEEWNTPGGSHRAPCSTAWPGHTPPPQPLPVVPAPLTHFRVPWGPAQPGRDKLGLARLESQVRSQESTPPLSPVPAEQTRQAELGFLGARGSAPRPSPGEALSRGSPLPGQPPPGSPYYPPQGPRPLPGE